MSVGSKRMLSECEKRSSEEMAVACFMWSLQQGFSAYEGLLRGILGV